MKRTITRIWLALTLAGLGAVSSWAAENCHYFTMLEKTVCDITRLYQKTYNSDMTQAPTIYDPRSGRYFQGFTDSAPECNTNDILVAHLGSFAFQPQVTLQDHAGKVFAVSITREAQDPGPPVRTVYWAELEWQCEHPGGPPLVYLQTTDYGVPGAFTYQWEVWQRLKRSSTPEDPACGCVDPASGRSYKSFLGQCYEPPGDGWCD